MGPDPLRCSVHGGPGCAPPDALMMLSELPVPRAHWKYRENWRCLEIQKFGNTEKFRNLGALASPKGDVQLENPSHLFSSRFWPGALMVEDEGLRLL